MDDCCAVCAEPLEWVAYGTCAHREVCSTCVVRLRNVCDDRRCCICKTDCSSVFITKALGDYTRVVEFSSLPADAREGKIGSYWYHEATQAFFDDIAHYKMIKAMCTFSCSVCDQEGHQNHGAKRKANFRILEQLKGHLFHQHRLLLCRLCLEGRKVFICEQKLYTKAQLNQHTSTGDSEVDGTESERGGFTGHPMCEFCRTPFYGENELYTHMSTEHYTCHMCQRQNPGHYDYYRNYDDLEVHFRQDHYLCEDEGCLGKKFIVFQSEAELKRHNALEHGGRMSRSKRNAVLQIPTSFSYRRPNESGARRGRGRAFRRQTFPDNQLSLAVQASLETANPESRYHDPPASSSIAQQALDDGGTILVDALSMPFESLAAHDTEPVSRDLHTMSHNYSHASLAESSFPPLSATPGNSQQKLQQEGDGLPQNTMAARLRQRNHVKILNVAQDWPAANRGPAYPSASSIQMRPTVNNIPVSLSGSSQTNKTTASSIQTRHTVNNIPASLSVSSETNKTTASSIQTWPTSNNNPASLSGSSQTNKTPARGPPPSSYASSVHVPPLVDTVLSWGGSSSSGNPSSSGRMKQSTSASNMNEHGSFDPVSDFPPVSGAQYHRSGGCNQTVKVEDIHAANKSLVERIHAALDHDQDVYAAFKDVLKEYRQGSVDTLTYLEFVGQFGLLHLVPDMAKLCLDPLKQKELIEAYNSSFQSNRSQEMFWGNAGIQVKEKKSSSSLARGKKLVDAESSSSKEASADNVLETVSRLQSGYRHSKGEVKALENGGYRASDGKSLVHVDESPVHQVMSNLGPSTVRAQNEVPSNGGKLSGDGGSKRGKKKTSKFHRARLGDGSAAALLDLRNPCNDPTSQDSNDDAQDSSARLPVWGVWQNGAGQKLFRSSKR